jgi:acyl-CoA reductase-like NAD-dependent aldehyde dehydrogenase
MLFGDAATTQPYEHDPRVQIHGPGLSKIIIGEDCIDHWPQFVDVIVSSIAENGGRSCLNASGVWVPSHGRELADALAAELAKIEALPAEDERARLAAFANPSAAEFFARTIQSGLQTPGAEDMTARHRGQGAGGMASRSVAIHAPDEFGGRLVRIDGCAYVLPTLVYCTSPDHPLANRELLLPYAAVVECPQSEMLSRFGPTLVATVISEDESFLAQVADYRHIDRLNIGPIPTWQISWDQPHEGNLFEHLYRRRAFQRAGESAAV